LKTHERMRTSENSQLIPKDPLEIKEESPNTNHDPIEMEGQCSSGTNQDISNSSSIKIENEIFYNAIKQEPG